ncbi:MAG: 16S rRNA (adenine(1518)-N(6)/adenine(1519)-N(6))-dimethyltransferase RsmA [Turicibacter sp.]|nr:16S rRNA (adenine(1518)-N(6)/adenine(1519)-N(6))-dimethyltransferase RsmA [Turicibacter sp.]
MMQIATYGETRKILERYNLSPKNSLGQNFLIDAHVLQKIIRIADITADDCVLEVGPGIGGLTQALLEFTGRLTVVEFDRKMVAILNDIFGEKLDIVQADILKYSVPARINKVVANLPYYITTPTVMYLLENYSFETITVMVQREVAERMTASAGSKSYGALSLAVQYHANVTIAGYVPPNSFLPRPSVTSCIVHLAVLKKPIVNTDKAALFANIKAGFANRRKTLVNCLYSSGLYDFSKDELAEILTYCGFSKDIRGEMLTLEDWAKITERLTTAYF